MMLFIDDEREPPESWSNQKHIVIRTSQDTIKYLEENGCPNYISFDHDLGLGSLGTGYDVVKWLVDKDLNNDGLFIPDDFRFYVHSQNPVGAKNIKYLLGNYIASKR